MRSVLLNVISWEFVRMPLNTFFIVLVLSITVFANALHAESETKEPYVVMDSFGQHYFHEPPKRVIVTDWTLLEQLLSLGVIPVGAPEIESYKRYSSFVLPESIQDIGSRRSPSPNIITDLEPDLILLGTDQKRLARPLSRITKVLYYQNFSPRFKNNGSTAIKRLGQIANVFLKQDSFARIRHDIEMSVTQHKQKIALFFSDGMPSVMAIRLFSNGDMITYSPHSPIGWVMGQLGLHNPIENKKTKFGEQSLSNTMLKNSNVDYVLCFGECSDAILGKAIETKKIIQLNEHWPYGGVATIQSLIEEISQKLMTH